MLEIIATTVEDAVLIEKGGADRIELVSALSEGGLTPSYGIIQQTIQAVHIPVNVMIRPHSQGYNYSQEDMLCMIEDIKQAKTLGANGVVLGVLDAEGNVDMGKLDTLLQHCQGLEVTFHRAIEKTADILTATRQLASTSITRVLSSGGPGHAHENRDVLREMQGILAEQNKKLLVGSGINKDNCKAIVQATHAQEIHVGTAVRHGSTASGRIDLAAVQALANSGTVLFLAKD